MAKVAPCARTAPLLPRRDCRACTLRACGVRPIREERTSWVWCLSVERHGSPSPAIAVRIRFTASEWSWHTRGSDTCRTEYDLDGELMFRREGGGLGDSLSGIAQGWQ